MTTNTTARIRGRGWAYVGVTLGGTISIAANIAHSYIPPVDAPVSWQPPAGAVVSAVFWPLALFVAIEILARTPWRHGHRWILARYLGLLPVALVAAVVSYRHLSGLLAYYSEDHLTVTIGPLAVDGLMIMATAALLATTPAGADPHADIPAPVDTDPATIPATTATPPAPVTAVVASAPLPAQLLTGARFAAVNHEQTTSRPITPDELAARMSITPAIAGQLLTQLNDPADRVNGTPITGGVR